jgi:septation ring formation regulator EzrA
MTPKLYLWLGVALVLSIVSGVALKYRGDAIKAEAQVITLKANNAALERANADKDKAIERQEARYRQLDKLLADVRDEVQNLTDESAATTKALTDLGETDVDVKDVLDRPYPDGLDRLLNN